MTSQSPVPGSVEAVWGHRSSSFAELLRGCAPYALPQAAPGAEQVHGTTIFAVHYRDGVLVAGDRRATMGNLIAQRDLRKLEPADRASCLAFAGTVGVGKEMVQLFQVELEHFEKIEHAELSFPAKVNRVSAMVRANLPQLELNLVATPLFAGWDRIRQQARIYTFDITGAPAEEKYYGGAGSGWFFARGALKKLHDPEMDRANVVQVALQALFDAADDDSATGGPDSVRAIYPTLALITEDGYEEVPADEITPHLPNLTV